MKVTSTGILPETLDEAEASVRQLIADTRRRDRQRGREPGQFERGQESGLFLALHILTGRPVRELRDEFDVDWYVPQIDAVIAARQATTDALTQFVDEVLGGAA